MSRIKKTSQNPFLTEKNNEVLPGEVENNLTPGKEKITLDMPDNEILNEIKEDYLNDKPKKERKKRVTKEEVNKAESFAKTFSFAAHIGLNIVVSRMPKNMPLTKDEETAFDDAFTSLATKYYDSFQRFGEEINFFMILGLIIIPRIEIKKKKNEVNGTTDNFNFRKNGNGQEHVSEKDNTIGESINNN